MAATLPEGRGLAPADHAPSLRSHPTSPTDVLTVRRRAAAGNYAELVDQEEDGRNTGKTWPQDYADLDRQGDRAGRIRAKIQMAGQHTKKSVSKLRRKIPEPIKSYCVPAKNRDEWLRFLFTRLPILSWVWNYKPKQIVGDLLAGIVIGFAHIPESECAGGVEQTACRGLGRGFSLAVGSGCYFTLVKQYLTGTVYLCSG